MTDNTHIYAQMLDASGLHCPMPIIRTRKALNGMQSGEVLYVVTTDDGSVNDIPAFARQTGNQLMEQKTEGGKYHFFIKKA